MAEPLKTQLVVIGSGPGGYSAAFRAADLGLEVTMVERFATLGGVCLNVGCIPSKALLHAAKVIDEAAAFADHGIRFGRPEIDLPALARWKDGVVGRLTGGIAGLAKRRSVKVIQGLARFTDPHRLLIETPAGPVELAFEQAILAVGSRPVVLPALALDDPRVLDSTGALTLADVPKRLLVVGGGIIGLEMACVYDALGARVTVVELADRLIPEADSDLVKPLAKRIAGRYEAILTETKVVALEARADGLLASFEGKKAPEPQLYDKVLVAVGRRPNGDRLGAEAAGLTVDARGFLAVDRQMRTNVPHILAIGDVVGQPMLAHKASHEGKVAAEVAAGQKSGFDAKVIPSVAYTDPEVAWVGLTERQAEAQGHEVEKGSFPWAANGRSLSLGRDEGLTKLLFDPVSHRLVGAGAVGPNAGELIAELGLAIEMGCEAADIGMTIHPHPTLSETVGMAAEAFEGTLTDLYIPKRRERKGR
jgi:dihydrolipoamide dehydrogenase